MVGDDERYNKQVQPNCTIGRENSSQTYSQSLVHEEMPLGIDRKGVVEIKQNVAGHEKTGDSKGK